MKRKIIYLSDYGKRYPVSNAKEQFWMAKVLVNAPFNPLLFRSRFTRSGLCTSIGPENRK